MLIFSYTYVYLFYTVCDFFLYIPIVWCLIHLLFDVNIIFLVYASDSDGDITEMICECVFYV